MQATSSARGRRSKTANDRLNDKAGSLDMSLYLWKKEKEIS
jgi:hypothetical protein